jgi:hypothetical protein
MFVKYLGILSVMDRLTIFYQSYPLIPNIHKTQKTMKKLTSILLLSLLTFAGFAQSPKATATGKIGETSVTVSYCQPAVKGRKIWGDLVPYGQVWRTGANDATVIEFSNDVMIEGKKLAKGKYALFTIPTEKDWTIVFNKDAKQWGAYSYKEGSDVLRVQVSPKKSAAMTERMTFAVNKSAVDLTWENLAVSFSVK